MKKTPLIVISIVIASQTLLFAYDCSILSPQACETSGSSCQYQGVDGTIDGDGTSVQLCDSGKPGQQFCSNSVKHTDNNCTYKCKVSGVDHQASLNVNTGKLSGNGC
jgi:hypothetical protein